MQVVNGTPVALIDENGQMYSSITTLSRMLGADRKNISKCIKRDGFYRKNGHTYRVANVSYQTAAAGNQQGFMTSFPVGENPIPAVQQAAAIPTQQQAVPTISPEEEEEFENFKRAQQITTVPFDKFEFKFTQNYKNGHRLAVALFSDAHIEETVEPNAVHHLNEYNTEIAQQRIERYFVNLVNCINEDKVDDLIFASLGDTISGFIHEELSQENGLTPLEATYLAQSLIYSGLDYICRNTKLKSIKFIGIVGNHSRVTKKIQHSNGFKMSYEWLMYKNIEKECLLTKLPIEFYLPESELAEVDADGKRFIFAHGFQIRGGGTNTVCGIYPSLNRLCMKWDRVFHQDHVFMGHFHTCVSIPNATVNGSIIGYTSFALSNGMSFEEPAQAYVVYDSSIGDELLRRKIYCK